MLKKPKHQMTEAEPCAGFIASATANGTWKAYPETAGFDILMVRAADGYQIGVEAKLQLNAKVISQALPRWLRDGVCMGPDYRAVLVPAFCTDVLGPLAAAIGITVIRCDARSREERDGYYLSKPYRPDLPSPQRGATYWDEREWHEWAPLQRCRLPDYVPDVAAGNPSPLQLTDWKIKAIKLAILLEERPVTRADFKALRLDPKRWLDPWPGWLRKGDGKGFVRAAMSDFKTMHPVNYEQIKADKAKWMPALEPKQASFAA